MTQEFSKCPMCPTGELQSTFVYLEGETLKAYGCNKCRYGYWEPQIDTKTYTISTTDTTSFEDQIAKEIAEMSDEEVDRNVKEFFFKPLQTDEGWEPPKPKTKIAQKLIKNFIDGPLKNYLTGDISYGKFIEEINEICETDFRYSDLYPSYLFNAELHYPE